MGADEASRAIRRLKGQHDEQPDSQPPEEEVADVATETADEDELDRVLDRIAKRHEQAAKIEAIRRLDEDDDGGEGERDPMDDFLRAVEVVESLSGSADTAGLDADEVRAIVREETAATAAADGGTADPVAEAVANGVTDPDALEQIAAVSPQNRSRWADVAERVIDRADGETLASVAETAMSALSRPSRPRRSPATDDAAHAAEDTERADVAGHDPLADDGDAPDDDGGRGWGEPRQPREAADRDADGES